jgi:putative ABC transport system permease protein
MAGQLLSWLRRLWHGHSAADLAEELEQHRTLIQADLERRGLSARAAAAESRRLMGNVALAQEDAREVWVVRWIDRLWREARLAARRLRHEPTFTLTAAITLALGVTTTTTVFSVADAELWKPLPYPQPHQLVAVYSRGPAANATSDGISGADLLDWRAHLRSFSAIGLQSYTVRRVLQDETARSVVTAEVTANYFAALGRPAISGRMFTDADGHGPRAALLTDRGWHALFGADPTIVGRSIVLDGVPFLVVGITRATDLFDRDPDLYLALDESSAGFLDPAQPLGYGFVARLRPGVRREEAHAELQSALTIRPERVNHRIVVQDLGEYYSGHNWRSLYFFLGASLLVLVLSAVNVASLFLARAAGRHREFALRSALGGGRAALARQLVVEGALVALPAGALGVFLSTWTVRAFTASLPADFLARGSDVSIDLRVCAFAFAATVVATIAFALVPLPLARRIDAASALRGGTRAGRSMSEGRARGLLMVVQLALTLMLMSGAGIFLKSFLALRQVPLGFDPNNLVSIRTTLSGPRYDSDAAVRAYTGRLLDQVRTVSGVRDVAVASSTPLASGPLTFFGRGDQPRPAPGDETRAILRNATPGYFRTLGITLIRGREFADADAAGAPPVAVINRTMAARLFGDEDPIGRVIDLLPGSRTPWTKRPGPLQVVGVADNVKQVELNEVDFADVYVPFAQMPSPRFELLVRTSTPAVPLIDRLRERAARVDPTIPITGASTLDDRVVNALRGNRFNLLLVSWFAGLAILLAATAVYGAVAHHVQTRTSEFGVRLALGAQPLELVANSVWRTARVAIGGALLGLAGTFVFAALIGNALYTVQGSHSGLLYSVRTTDPVSLASACAGLVLIALVAGALPARHVARVDPVRALRSE